MGVAVGALVGAAVGSAVGANVVGTLVGEAVGASVHALQYAGHAARVTDVQPSIATVCLHSGGSGSCCGHFGVGYDVGAPVGCSVGSAVGCAHAVCVRVCVCVCGECKGMGGVCANISLPTSAKHAFRKGINMNTRACMSTRVRVYAYGPWPKKTSRC